MKSLDDEVFDCLFAAQMAEEEMQDNIQISDEELQDLLETWIGMHANEG